MPSSARHGPVIAVAVALAMPSTGRAAPAADAIEETETTVHVHLEATGRGRALELFEVTEETLSGGMGSGGLSFRRKCGQPCDLHVTARAEYFVASGRNTESKKFTIDAHGDRVIVRARPGSRAAGIVGEVLIGVGALLIVSGAGLLIAGKMLPRQSFVPAGGGMIGGGLGALVIGIPLGILVGHVRIRSVTRG